MGETHQAFHFHERCKRRIYLNGSRINQLPDIFFLLYTNDANLCRVCVCPWTEMKRGNMISFRHLVSLILAERCSADVYGDINIIFFGARFIPHLMWVFLVVKVPERSMILRYVLFDFDISEGIKLDQWNDLTAGLRDLTIGRTILLLDKFILRSVKPSYHRRNELCRTNLRSVERSYDSMIAWYYGKSQKGPRYLDTYHWYLGLLGYVSHDWYFHRHQDTWIRITWLILP